MSSRSYYTETISDSSRGFYTGESQGYRRPAYLEVVLKVARNGAVQASCSPEVLDDPRMSSLVRELRKLMRAHHRDIEAIYRPSQVTVKERASQREYERRMKKGVPHPSGRIFQDGRNMPGGMHRSRMAQEEKRSSTSSQQSDRPQRATRSAVQALDMEQRNLDSGAERGSWASYIIFHSHYWRPLISDRSLKVVQAVKSIHKKRASAEERSRVQQAERQGLAFHLPKEACPGGCAKCARQRASMNWPDGVTLSYEPLLYTEQKLSRLLSHYRHSELSSPHDSSRQRDKDDLPPTETPQPASKPVLNPSAAIQMAAPELGTISAESRDGKLEGMTNSAESADTVTYPPATECQLQHRAMSAKSLYDPAMQPAALQPVDLLKARQELRPVDPEPQACKQSKIASSKPKSPWAHIKLRSVNLFKRNRKNP